MSKKYLLFDNDGVLVETEPWYLKASQKALKEFFDFDFYKDDYMKLMINGGSVWQGVEALGASTQEVNKAREKRNEYYQEYLKNEDIAIDGVQELLQKLSSKYKMAIVTTSRRVDFEIIHKNRGIVQYMDFVLCEEDYDFAKPHPEPYLCAMRKFKASKNECIIIEDSKRGLSSAVSANIDCAIVYNEFTTSQDFSNATYKISSLNELEKLLENLEK